MGSIAVEFLGQEVADVCEFLASSPDVVFLDCFVVADHELVPWITWELELQGEDLRENLNRFMGLREWFV